MRYAFSVDGKRISPTQRIELSKIAKISMEIVRLQAMFTDKVRGPLIYAAALPKDYTIRFVDFCVTDIADDTIFSSFLAINSSATYIRNIRAGMIMIKH